MIRLDVASHSLIKPKSDNKSITNTIVIHRGFHMPRKGKGVKRILREEKRLREKKKQGEKSWQYKKKNND